MQHVTIAGKQTGIQMLNDCGNVERLIADAVPIAAAIQDRHKAENQCACGERRSLRSDQ